APAPAPTGSAPPQTSPPHTAGPDRSQTRGPCHGSSAPHRREGHRRPESRGGGLPAGRWRSSQAAPLVRGPGHRQDAALASKQTAGREGNEVGGVIARASPNRLSTEFSGRV